MYVICDNRNIVRAIAQRAVYVKAQTNGVTILADSYRNSTAIYCEDDDSYWATKESIAGQKTYTLYQVEEIPEGAERDITRYNNGVLEVDPELKSAVEQEKFNSLQQRVADLEATVLVLMGGATNV